MISRFPTCDIKYLLVVNDKFSLTHASMYLVARKPDEQLSRDKRRSRCPWLSLYRRHRARFETLLCPSSSCVCCQSVKFLQHFNVHAELRKDSYTKILRWVGLQTLWRFRLKNISCLLTRWFGSCQAHRGLPVGFLLLRYSVLFTVEP